MFIATNSELNLQGQVGAGGGWGALFPQSGRPPRRGQTPGWPSGGTPTPGNLGGRWV